MRDESHRESVRSLQRPVRARPPWRHRIVRLVVSVALSAAIAGATSNVALYLQGHDCASLAHKGYTDRAVVVCSEEFHRTGEPKAGLQLAYVLAGKGLTKEARPLATPSLTTTDRADALQLLGEVALIEDHNEEGVIALEEARFLHRFMMQYRDLARDDGFLASVRTNRGEFVDAVRLLEECLNVLRWESDLPHEWYCLTTKARTLLHLGYYTAAEKALDAARRLADGPQQIDIDYQLASLAQERGEHAQAIVGLEAVLRERERSGSTAQVIITEQNLSYSHAMLGHFLVAKQHLEHARRLDIDRQHEQDRLWTAARIAYEEGDHAGAATMVQRYFELLRVESTDGGPNELGGRDVPIEVASLGAQSELARGNLPAAESWAQRAVAEAESVRSAQTLELRPWVLKKRRFAYELLFLSLARAGNVEKAAMKFDLWQGRAVQDALARHRLDTSNDSLSIVDQIVRLRKMREAVRAPLGRPADRSAVLEVMCHADVVALIVADGEVWRLTASHGAPHLAKVAALAAIQPLVRRFASHPAAELQSAKALGAVLLPDDVFRATSETLHVVLDDQLLELPVSALRHGETPLAALRPSVRELRLPEVRCVPPVQLSHAIVLANPVGALPAADDEVKLIATTLPTKSKTGHDATTAAVLAAGRDALLHVASRTLDGEDGAALEMSDGALSALEIAAHGLGPGLVVLSDCGTAVSRADSVELIDSLVGGFLAAGSQHVVATLRSISDGGTPQLMEEFYRASGVADPVRALQAAQLKLSTIDNAEWSAFAVFGPDVCPQDVPAQSSGHP